MGQGLKHLKFDSLRNCLGLIFRDLPDRRQQAKVKHTMHDVVMSGFAMMYCQDGSLLRFQRRLEEQHCLSNLKTIFAVEKVPEDTQMREILDGLDRELFRPAFKSYLHRLQRGKHLEQYRLWDGSYFCPIDGTEYFGSDRIHCSGCLRQKTSGRTVRYSHQILQGAIVHPDHRQVFPLMPEEIRNTDGTQKQDCEMNAGKRFIQQLRRDHPRMKITIGGDGLTSKQPMIEAIRAEKMGFILVAKPDDHKIMMEWVAEQKQLGQVRTQKVETPDGKCHVYEWLNQVG